MIQTIVLKKRLDRDEIDLLLISGDTIVDVVNEYNSDLFSGAEADIADMDPGTIEAFKTVVDFVSYLFEATYPVLKVDYDAEDKAFDFGRSYLRDAVSTETVTPLADETPFIVRFEFAGFAKNEVVEVTGLYNADFSTPDKELLAEHGVNILASGTGFSFTNTRECKVYFSKPEAVSGKYVVQYPALETIIPAESGI